MPGAEYPWHFPEFLTTQFGAEPSGLAESHALPADSPARNS